MNPSFSIKESLRFGWKKVRDHSALVFQVVLTLFAVQVANSIVGKVLAGSVLGITASIVLLLLMIVLGVGATIISLKLVREEAAQYSDLFPSAQLVARYFFSELLAGVMAFLPFLIGISIIGVTLVSVGFGNATAQISAIGAPIVVLCLVVVAISLVCMIYLLIRYSMARFFIIDGAKIVESLHKSAVMTKGNKWHLLGFIFATIGILILGVVVFFVGLLVAIPISMIAYAYVYQKLLSGMVEVVE